MDGSNIKKSRPLETLEIKNIANVSDLKATLNDIIKAGKYYDYDVSSCIKSLLNSSDPDIVLLSVQAVSELVKCEDKRMTYAQKDIIQPILNLMLKEVTSGNIELLKQCCRSLGNLCCDCDMNRNIILECNGIPVLIKLLEKSLDMCLDEIKMLVCKTLLNYAVGGQEFCESIAQGDSINLLQRILNLELEKEDMDDDAVSTALLLLSVINENITEFQYKEDVNTAVLKVLKETSNVDISELCLDHLHTQAEHEAVKTLIANEGGVQLVVSRLEQLMNKHKTGDLNADDSDIQAIIKQACDLLIIVLTGDEAMHKLYNNGVGEVYLTMVKWLESTDYNLLTTSVLAIGNFARQDDYCTQLMQDKIFDKLLDIFEVYHGFSVRMQREPDIGHPIDAPTVNKVQHAVLSALRNLTVPVANKRVAAAHGRAVPLMLKALPYVEDHHVAHKLLAAIRMLVDGQEGVAKQVASDPRALSCVARWGRAGHGAGAAGEAPRLLAWTVRQLRHSLGAYSNYFVQVDGCISSLVNMLISSHSIMQNEAILALTLLGIEALNKQSPNENSYDYEKSFTSQLLNSEVGKHVAVLVDTNCAKMPVEVAENLLAFLDVTSKKNRVAIDYKEAKVPQSLTKFIDSRKDLNNDLKICISAIVISISDKGLDE